MPYAQNIGNLLHIYDRSSNVRSEFHIEFLDVEVKDRQLGWIVYLHLILFSRNVWNFN